MEGINHLPNIQQEKVNVKIVVDREALAMVLDLLSELSTAPQSNNTIRSKASRILNQQIIGSTTIHQHLQTISNSMQQIMEALTVPPPKPPKQTKQHKQIAIKYQPTNSTKIHIYHAELIKVHTGKLICYSGMYNTELQICKIPWEDIINIQPVE
jgi:hypothetical protein